MSLSSIFQWRGFWAVLFFLFFAFPQDQAFASTWGDVISALDTCSSNPDCSCWIEEIFVPVRVYRVWRRCDTTSVYSSKRIAVSYSSGQTTDVPYAGAWACDGTGNFATIPANTGYYNYASQFPMVQDKKCSGAITETPATTGAVPAFVAMPASCLLSVLNTGVNCRASDILFAEFGGIVNSCVPNGVCTTNPVTHYMSCGCSCIPEGYKLTAYTDTNGNGSVDLLDTCGFYPAIGDLTDDAPNTGTSGSTGGSVNTGCVGCNGPDTDADGIPDATDTDCSGPGCSTTSTSSSSNPDGTTTTTSTTTIHQGGGITPTVTTTTSTTGTGSTTPGSTTTTTTDSNGTVTTGCIDVNGDGLDDGSGLECSPAGRQFSAPSVAYDPTLETLPQDDIPSRLTGWLSQNPYVTVVQGTRVQVSDLQCSLSFTLFNKPMSISFCELQTYVSLFGAVFVGVCGIRSVLIALGGE